MDLIQAKQIVIDAGHKLVAEGLVARTWGNISCKVDNETFVITPSGRNYEDLTLEDIVPVKIEDCTWEGPIKPSSEKGIHANAYKLRSDVNAVIHTHQLVASTVASARRNITVNQTEREIFGGDIACAGYGLPGTGKLKKATVAALSKTGSKAALMANHGALCIGTDMNDAFAVASQLEKTCTRFILQEASVNSGKEITTIEALHQTYLSNKGAK